MAGFYEGVLESMKTRADIRQSDAAAEYNRTMAANAAEDQAFQRQRMPATLKADEQSLLSTDIQNQTQALELRQKELLMKKQAYEANLVKNMTAASNQYKAPEDMFSQYKGMADMNRRIGKEMLAVDPVGAKKYFDTAANYESQADNMLKTSLDIKAKQMDVVGNTLLGVKSQEDWNEAIQVLSQNSVAVPPQFRDWNNPATQQYVEKLAFRSPTIASKFKEERGFLDVLETQKNEATIKGEQQERTYNQSLAERLAVAGVKSKSQGKIGAYEGLYTNTFVTNANEFIVGAANLAAITQGFETELTRGMFADLKGDGLLSATEKFLSKKVTDKELLQYEAITAPLIRQAGLILNNGRPIVTKETADQIKKSIVVDAGEPREVFLQKIGDMRTLYEKALESQLRSPYFQKPGTEQQREQLEENLKQIKKAIPFTANQVARFTAAAKKNPNLTFRDWLKENTQEEVIGYEAPKVSDDRASQFKIIRKK